MEQTGKVIQLCEKKTGISQSTGNAWASQDFILETGVEPYLRKAVFNAYGEERIRLFDLHVGDVVKVSFDIDAHEYNGRWFNSIRVWKVEKIYKDTAATAEPSGWHSASMPQPKPYQPQPQPQASQGDIPF